MQFPRASEQLVALARQSFAVDPLEVSTLRTLALGSVLHEDEARAGELLRLAIRISKRDAMTSLWLAQDYGKRGEVEEMMSSFDYALRTSTRTRETAMRPLVDLLGNESSYVPLARLLNRGPEWERAFWREFVRNPVAIRNSVRFFNATSLPLNRLEPAERNRLYANLKASGQFNALYQLAVLDPDAQAADHLLTSDSFKMPATVNPFGWTTYSRGNSSAYIQPTTEELQIDAKAGSFGLAAERLVMLDRGHTLAIAMAGPVPENATLELAAECADGSEQRLARMVLHPGEKDQELALKPNACTFVFLKLSFAVEPGRRDALMRVASIALRPV